MAEATVGGGGEEGTVAAACCDGVEVRTRWGIEGGRWGARHDMFGMAKISPEKEIRVVAARPELGKTEAVVRRRVGNASNV